MNKKTISVAAVLILLSLFLENGYACSTIIAGKKATADGCVLFGHNEDDGGRRVVNVWRVPRYQYAPGTTVTLLRGGALPQVEETWAYTWFQVNDLEFSDYYINEWGVYIGSDACASREDNPELKDGGIGYLLRRLMAERATTAREAVEIAGKLLDEFGYAVSGRTYAICDADEGWLLNVAAGKHWAAQRIPDDEVAFLPNQYVIRTIDFKNTRDFITSSDNVRDYAIRRGWYDPASGKPFDFAYAYMPPAREGSTFSRRGYDTRQWRAQALMTGTPVTVEQARREGLPFSVKPNRKISVADFKEVLRDHYDGTEYGPANSVSAVLPPTTRPDEMQQTAIPTRITVNPNETSERTICTQSTSFSIIAQLRGDMPRGIGLVAWVAFGRPDCNVYVPWYHAMEEIPEGYNNSPGIDDPGIALEHQFDVLPGTFRFDDQAAFWIFTELENTVDPEYPRAMRQVKPVIEAFEEFLHQNQGAVEKTALKLNGRNGADAARYLGAYTSAMTAESMKKAKTLVRELKSYYYR
ncbi:C69 family dipeptidase [bacterium]|nr:C69 family dipeptidase [bacterium]